MFLIIMKDQKNIYDFLYLRRGLFLFFLIEERIQLYNKSGFILREGRCFLND